MANTILQPPLTHLPFQVLVERGHGAVFGDRQRAAHRPQPRLQRHRRQRRRGRRRRGRLAPGKERRRRPEGKGANASIDLYM